MRKFLITTLTILMFINASVFADDSDSASSKSEVSFVVETPTKPTEPRDPLDPNKPLGSSEEGTGSIGLLTIDYVPNFTFGTQKITRDYEVYESTNVKPFVQVTDLRANGSGWILQASLGQFVHDNGIDTLGNAAIILRNPEVATFNGNGDAPVPSYDTLLVAGDPVPTDIMVANKDGGMGTWLMRWLAASGQTNENALLTLDTRDARSGSYSSTITWYLVQTP